MTALIQTSQEALTDVGCNGGQSAPNEQIDAVRHYTGDGAARINRWLRTGEGSLTEFDRAAIRNLDAAFAAASSPETTVYRGLSTVAAREFMLNVRRVGAIVVEKGFASTSKSYAVADAFRSRSREWIMLRISVPKGSQAIDISSVSDAGRGEQEVLFARNIRLKVVSFDRKKRVAEVKLMSPKTTSDAEPNLTVLVAEIGAPYNRFVEDGYGLVIDNSEADGEEIDWLVLDDGDDK